MRDDLLERDPHAQLTLNIRRRDVHHRGAGAPGVAVDQAAGHRAPGPLPHQFERPHHAFLREVRMHAAREPIRRFRRQALRLDRPADVDEVPGGAFEQDVRGGLRHLRLGAAHHAGQRQRPLPVAHEHRERIRACARRRPASCSVSPASGRRVMIVGRFAAGAPHEHVPVEGVQRLAQFEHHEVGRVDDVADRPGAGQPQPALHPVRARRRRARLR